ncbi:hypothetical protein C8F01DRAFT_161751 [Mycena amicta]|nr:hypothetical protein C8F01DRAFT_161751 [Mycena amicta]
MLQRLILPAVVISLAVAVWMTRSHPRRLSPVVCKSPYSRDPFHQCHPNMYPRSSAGQLCALQVVSVVSPISGSHEGVPTSTSSVITQRRGMVRVVALSCWAPAKASSNSAPSVRLSTIFSTQYGARRFRTLHHSSPWSRPPLSSALPARVLSNQPTQRMIRTKSGDDESESQRPEDSQCHHTSAFRPLRVPTEDRRAAFRLVVLVTVPFFLGPWASICL